MTRVIVIGATGHVGTYLVPALVEAGHDVVAISRGVAEPYRGTRPQLARRRRVMGPAVHREPDRQRAFSAAFLASARNFSRPASVSGCLNNCQMIFGGAVITSAPILAEG